MDYMEIRYKKNGSSKIINTQSMGMHLATHEIDGASFEDVKVTGIMGMNGYYPNGDNSQLISRDVTATLRYKTRSAYDATRRIFEEANSCYGQIIFSDDPDIYWEGYIAVKGCKKVTKNGSFYDLTISMEAQPTPRLVSNGQLIQGGTTGINPTGTLTVNANGEYNCKMYEFVVVDVPDTGIIPTGTKLIASNGTHDVENYKYVNVKVEGTEGGGSAPSVQLGAKNIFRNGTYYAADDDLDGWTSVTVDTTETYDSINGGDFSFTNGSFTWNGGVID